MIRISLCMIVRDEEDVLARCLDSVRPLVDEIIIVDTGSQDATCSIAQPYADKLLHIDWVDDFAAARNVSFSHATGDYLLWLDADDVILPADLAEFLELKKTLPSDVDFVMMRYNTSFDAQGNPTMSYYRERLIRNDPSYRWQGRVHEAVTPRGKVICSPIAVTHRKMRPGDTDRNLRIFQRMIQEGQPLEPRMQYYYARELMFHHQEEEAAAAFRQFLQEGQGWVENNIGACQDLSCCLERLGRTKEALDALFSSFRYDCPRPEVCCELGRLFYAQKQYRMAIYWYETAMSCPQVDSMGFQSPDCRDFVPTLQLCLCWFALGDRKKARAFHEKARAIKPNDPAVVHNDAFFAQLPD